MGMKWPREEAFGTIFNKDGQMYFLIGTEYQINILTIYVVIVRTYLSADEKHLLERKSTRVLWFFHFPW